MDTDRSQRPQPRLETRPRFDAGTVLLVIMALLLLLQAVWFVGVSGAPVANVEEDRPDPPAAEVDAP